MEKICKNFIIFGSYSSSDLDLRMIIAKNLVVPNNILVTDKNAFR